MEAQAVIEYLHLFRNRIPSLRVMREVSIPRQFILQRTEEALARRVIVAVALPAHARHHDGSHEDNPIQPMSGGSNLPYLKRKRIHLRTGQTDHREKAA